MTLNDWIAKHSDERRNVKIGTEKGAAFLYCGQEATKRRIMEISIHIFNEHYEKWQKLLNRFTNGTTTKAMIDKEEKYVRSFKDFGNREILHQYRVEYGKITVLIIEGFESLNIWDDMEQRRIDTKYQNRYNQKERATYERRRRAYR